MRLLSAPHVVIYPRVVEFDGRCLLLHRLRPTSFTSISRSRPLASACRPCHSWGYQALWVVNFLPVANAKSYSFLRHGMMLLPAAGVFFFNALSVKTSSLLLAITAMDPEVIGKVKNRVQTVAFFLVLDQICVECFFQVQLSGQIVRRVVGHNPAACITYCRFTGDRRYSMLLPPARTLIPILRPQKARDPGGCRFMTR